MSEFAVEILPVTIEPHPNADMIEIARVGDYCSIVQKGQFKDGDYVAYIPEQSILPEWVLDYLNLKGRLSGSAKNRVKAIKLRGVVSQGICFPIHMCINDAGEPIGEAPLLMDTQNGSYPVMQGEDVAEKLGIQKYIPQPPVHMAGQIAKGDYYKYAVKYEPENTKKRNKLIADGTPVVMTEKIHGTFCVCAFIPDAISMREGLSHGVLISSKGLFKNGHILDTDSEENRENNLYIKTIINTGLIQKFVNHPDLIEAEYPIYFFGEIYGKGVQDLTYGAQEPKFRLFDIASRNHDGELIYFDYEIFLTLAAELDMQVAPIIYSGPFSKEKMLEATSGKEMVSGQQLHMREGVVVKPIIEQRDNLYGRVIVKSISDEYLLRKNGTEYN